MGIQIPNVGKFILLPTRSREPGQIRGFEWSVEVSMDQAELVKIQKGGAGLAPETGYQRSFHYGSAAGNQKWTGAIQERYAFRTRSGLYGLINFHLAGGNPDGELQGSLEVRLNDGGSRNLDR